MSADLFAAFGTNLSSPSATEDQNTKRAVPAVSSNALIPGFETLEIQHQSYERPSRPKQEYESLWRRDDGGTDVLFDATEDVPQADEDFGDFEDANAPDVDHTSSSAIGFPREESTNCEPPQRPGSQMPMHDLLGLDHADINETTTLETSNRMPMSSISISALQAKQPPSTVPVDDDWGEFSEPTTIDIVPLAKGTKAQTQQVPVQRTEVQHDRIEDEWAPFDDDETESSSRLQAQKQHPGLTAPPKPSALQQGRVPQAKPTTTTQQSNPRSTADIRPSNIPPPAILLQYLPGVFDELRQTATQPVKQTPGRPSSPPKREIALAIIQAFTVAARVIAGRTLRWKRDAILVQSMRMGPAASGGGGRGMKLAAIDKSENLKEEKEAADVVGSWGKSAHLFNSTVSKAGIQRPLMALYLSVRPRLTSGVDVLKASHACALCGINRDERVSQVDVNVEDSFGEYWIEYWGHRDCRDFWTSTYVHRLHQR
jgi:hypothetical protein